MTNSISGYVWNDVNANGIQDSGEVLLNNIKIELLNFEGTVIKVIEAQNGFYSFQNLDPGPYVVKADLGSTFLQTYPGAITTFHATPVNGHWDYNDTNGLPVGPSEWKAVAPDADGLFQSPINIAGTPPENLGEIINFNYHKTNLTELVNKGTNIEIEYAGGNGNTISFANEQFELVQFHFHYSSEHQLDGRLSDMELHMVHRNIHGGLAVVGLLINQGETNQTLEPFFEGVKKATNPTTEIEEAIDLNELIPANEDGWYYQGSLTAPPAAEGVNWFVFKKPIELSLEQINIFRDYLASIGFDHNNRPVQPLHGRQLNEFNHEITLSVGDVINDANFGVTMPNEISGTGYDDKLTGTIGVDRIEGLEGNDRLQGGAGNDILNGGDGNDQLWGGTGNDLLNGGEGNDSYYVDSAGDRITELLGEGSDTVYSSIDYSLVGKNIENLTLQGAAINGSGNSFNNRLIGNASNNLLTGGVGNDILNGREGNDTLVGGIGNDSYSVDSTDDQITELLGEGSDTVYSSIDYSLVGKNIENLTLQGAAINGSGNSFNNRLIGNASNNLLTGGIGNDYLHGGEGNDTLVGGVGNDFYYINSTGDRITELLGEGSDTVYSFINYNLAGKNLENLTLQGTAINGSGNSFNNRLIGNASNNLLTGGIGNDYLHGGGGHDTLVGGRDKDVLVGGTEGDNFNYKNLRDSLLGSYDVIKDFNANEDKFLVATTPTVFNQAGAITVLSEAGIRETLTTTNFVDAQYAAQFNFGTRTFVAINNSVAGFQSGSDALIELTTSGLVGNLSVNSFVTT